MEHKGFVQLTTGTTYVIQGYDIYYSLIVGKNGLDTTFTMWCIYGTGILSEYIEDTGPNTGPDDKIIFVVKENVNYKYPKLRYKYPVIEGHKQE